MPMAIAITVNSPSDPSDITRTGLHSPARGFLFSINAVYPIALIKCLSYYECADAKSSAGFSRPNEYQGAQAPTPSGAFCVCAAPGVLLFGHVQGETFGSAGVYLGSRSANPLHVATILFSSDCWPLVLNHTKDNQMLNDVISLRDSAPRSACTEQATHLTFQLIGINKALCELAVEVNTNNKPSEHLADQISHLTWAMATLLELQQRLLLGEGV